MKHLDGPVALVRKMATFGGCAIVFENVQIERAAGYLSLANGLSVLERTCVAWFGLENVPAGADSNSRFAAAVDVVDSSEIHCYLCSHC